MSLGTDHFGEEFFNWPVHEGKALQELDRLDEAKKAWKEGKSSPGDSETQNKYRNMCSMNLK